MFDIQSSLGQLDLSFLHQLVWSFFLDHVPIGLISGLCRIHTIYFIFSKLGWFVWIKVFLVYQVLWLVHLSLLSHLSIWFHDLEIFFLLLVDYSILLWLLLHYVHSWRFSLMTKVKDSRFPTWLNMSFHGWDAKFVTIPGSGTLLLLIHRSVRARHQDLSS